MRKGIAGIAAVKNLTEAGFDVTGFEASDAIGGLWHYTEDARTSCLSSKLCHPLLNFRVLPSFYPTDTRALGRRDTVSELIVLKKWMWLIPQFCFSDFPYAGGTSNIFRLHA